MSVGDGAAVVGDDHVCVLCAQASKLYQNEKRRKHFFYLSTAPIFHSSVHFHRVLTQPSRRFA